jgi:hypothetical protein
MKPLFARRGELAVLAVWLFLSLPVPAYAEAPAPSLPVIVRVAIRLHNLAGIDEVKEQWQVTGSLIASWRDRSLAYKPRSSMDVHRDLRRSAWRPTLGFRNEVTPAVFKGVDIYVEPNGTVVYWQDFSATLSTDLDLRRFPFDDESLPIVVEPLGDDAEHAILRFDPELTTVPRARYAGLAQWRVVALNARPYQETAALRSVRGVVFDLQLTRNPASYVWKFIIPLILLVIVSWVSFWLSHKEFTTKDQLGTAVSTLLIVVAFNFVLGNQLPRTSYITYIDALLITSFIFVVISIGFIVATNLLAAKKSEEQALQLRRMAGIALPVLFLITQAILFVSFRI